MSSKLFSSLFWNVRGLGRYSKRFMVKSYARELGCSVLGIQESKLSASSIAIIKQISGFLSPSFISLDAIGSSGGLLLIWDDEIWATSHTMVGQHFLSASLMHRSSHIYYTFINVYGPPRSVGRSSFLAELVPLLQNVDENIIMGGDYNITIFDHERKNCAGSARDSERFSRFIMNQRLIDLPLLGRKYTWTNNQFNPSLAKLDRVLISLACSSSLPFAAVSVGGKKLSDHSALIFRSYISTAPIARPFQMELWWLRHAVFNNILRDGLSTPSPHALSAGALWSYRWRKLRKLISQWAAIQRKEMCSRRLSIEADLNALYHKAEHVNLNDNEISLMRSLKSELDEALSTEDSYWRRPEKAALFVHVAKDGEGEGVGRVIAAAAPDGARWRRAGSRRLPSAWLDPSRVVIVFAALAIQVPEE
ncbi:hypothetical protein Cni_G00566 [Canna indica]|uniref:Endonuclease/exonuclease/phosphatase domain-containing protein n=1 Tax=Canna indica TaxID=4628 RepID=A0AAQ3PWT0_9LILI|nr:hypothetical protein Cni_G00566 [Canna indica]